MDVPPTQVEMPASNRHTRQRTRTRERLLDAAREVLVRLGAPATTIADITRAADVGVGTFYLHFRDKDDLLRCLLEDGLERMRVDVSAMVAPLPLARRLPVAIRAICEALFTHRSIIRIAYSSGTLLDIVRRGQEILAGYLRCAIEAAQVEGLVKDTVDAPLVADLVSGMILQSALWWGEHVDPAPDRMAGQIIALLRGGLPPALFEE